MSGSLKHIGEHSVIKFNAMHRRREGGNHKWIIIDSLTRDRGVRMPCIPALGIESRCIKPFQLPGIHCYDHADDMPNMNNFECVPAITTPNVEGVCDWVTYSF